MRAFKIILAVFCFASVFFPGVLLFSGLSFFGIPTDTEDILYTLVLVAFAAVLIRMGRFLLARQNSPISKLAWAMVFVTAAACVVPTAATLWRLAHFKKALPPCVWQLRRIENAKRQWAGPDEKTPADIPTWDDLRPYCGLAEENAVLMCPKGRTYTLGRVGETPTCSIGGREHTLHYREFVWLMPTTPCLICFSIGLQLLEFGTRFASRHRTRELTAGR